MKKGVCTPQKKKNYSHTSSSLSEAVNLTFSISKYSRFAAKHTFCLLTHFFNGGFKLLIWKVSKDHLGLLDHLGICFEVLVKQFTLQRRKQPEFGSLFQQSDHFHIQFF